MEFWKPEQYNNIYLNTFFYPHSPIYNTVTVKDGKKLF